MKSQEANAIPLREILEKYGHEPVRSYHGYLMYSSPFRNEETPSFMVKLHTNKWKDFGEDSSGGVADLVMRLERCDFHSAMRRIEKSDLSAPSDPLPVPTSAGDAGTSPRLTVDNINPLTNRMLLEYMGRRGIDADIAKAYCKEAYYHFSGRKDRRCFAVAFPNDKGGMELRNPIFKGCAGVKAVTCLDNGGDRCAVFEGFMDFLSYLQYAREHPGTGWYMPFWTTTRQAWTPWRNWRGILGRIRYWSMSPSGCIPGITISTSSCKPVKKKQ